MEETAQVGPIVLVPPQFLRFSCKDALEVPKMKLLEESFRWFGPSDPVPLSHIRQTGATAVFTSLHDIPYGEAWPLKAIEERKSMLAAAGLRWSVVESLPVHEDIKTGTGDLAALFENYQTSLRNVATAGVSTVIYNFMPVLDWVRTDINYALPDGSECLKFSPVHFAAFDLFALQRAGANEYYDLATQEQASEWWDSLEAESRSVFIQRIIDVFPGVKLNYTLEDIREMLSRYVGIDQDRLRENLGRFLEAVVPTAEEVGVKLAVHPDDPPFPLLGLPRIVSTSSDIDKLLSLVDAAANGLCFCTGSLGARSDNDLPAMVKKFGPKIHAAHLRSTLLEPDGSFYEADHLAGSVDMPKIVRALLDEQDRRGDAAQIPFRPDHGHTMMDDLDKPPFPNPGYSCIGRMRGLAELRGVMHGLRFAEGLK